jgi:hypothetical protein
VSSLPTLLNLVVTTLQTCSHCTSVAVVETKEFSEEQFFPGLENFPHHQHTPRGGIVSSTLCGDPAIDLPEVLKAIGKFLESDLTPT